MQWYSQQVANHPSAVILVVFSLASAAIIVSFTTRELPNFKDPLLGFEPRGTVLAQRATAWNNLLSASSWNGLLSMYPGTQDQPGSLSQTTTATTLNSSVMTPALSVSSAGPPMPSDSSLDDGQGTMLSTELLLNQSQPEMVALLNKRGGAFGRLIQGPPPATATSVMGGLDKERQKGKRGPQKTKTELKKKPGRAKGGWKLHGSTSKGGASSGGSRSFFCSNPARNHGHVVLGARQGDAASGRGLFTPEALLSICVIDRDALRSPGSFEVICERQSNKGPCCNSWSIPNYVALLHNRSSCLHITPDDVDEVLQRLQSCAPHYHSMKLSHDCTSDALLCRGLPQECTEHNAVYNMLHYLADAHFLGPKKTAAVEENALVPMLSYTNVFLPIAQSTAAMTYFKDLERNGRLSDDIVEVVAMELGLKHALFDEYLVHDTVYVALAGVAVLAVMWAYTQSFLVTLVTCLAVVFSLGTAYFLYTTVFRVPFFPFMNILTLTIAIGIGADDAFIYCKTWGCAKAEKNNGTQDRKSVV